MLSKLASDLGLKINPKNLSDEELEKIRDECYNGMNADFDAISLSFRRDHSMRVEVYQEKMTEIRKKHVRNFFQLVGEPID